jgi:hypothetical protein
MRRCDQNVGDGNINFDEKELICGGCSSKDKGCKDHGSIIFINI